ncbi:MAG: short-subunit dehydrogenase [Urechidicola sp.]|mgnify:FL=1|jgi:short-subunit dehydrogenase|tara:strand:- start:508 stop:1326 length:819 start_codon:yes stop_codon:yes gene_type:complete
MKTYTNKTVLITGASSGIGMAMAHDLCGRGANLILVARSTEKLNGLAELIRKKGKEAHVFTSDLSVSGSAEKLHSEINNANLQVDLLINNAGYGRWGEFTDFDLQDYNKMIQLNITTLTELCHLYVTDMEKRKNGGIINVGSTASFVPIPYGNVYSSTKAYVLMFSEALNYECREKGIHVMALCPGGTQSQFMAVATEKDIEVQKIAKKRTSSVSFQTSEEVAKECLDAYEKGKIYHIAGRSNRRNYALSKYLSRKKVLNMVGKMFGQVVGK